MDSGYYLCYKVDEKDKAAAIEKTGQPPYPVLVRGPLQPASFNTITLRRNREQKQYVLDNMVYVKSFNKVVLIYFSNLGCSLEFRLPLHKLKKMLGTLFVCINSRCLVNKHYVKEWGNRKNRYLTLSVDTPSRLRISKRCYTPFCMQMKKSGC